MIGDTHKIDWSNYRCQHCKGTNFDYNRMVCSDCDCDLIMKPVELIPGREPKLDPAQWAIIKDTEALRAIGFRILVLEDKFTSGYECRDCGGSGHTDVKCAHCNGTTFWKGDAESGSCPDCEIGSSDGRKSLGYEICPACQGRTGVIIIPDDAKRRPCTGVVLSRGKNVTEFEIGTRVLYTNYTGTDFEILGGIKLRIMLEHDVMCEYKKLKLGPQIGRGPMTKELQDHGIAT